MPVKKPAPSKSTNSFVLGRERFEKISAVEGIKQTSAMKKRAASFDKAQISAAERRRKIIKAYREC